jgi:hypothetical protein
LVQLQVMLTWSTAWCCWQLWCCQHKLCMQWLSSLWAACQQCVSLLHSAWSDPIYSLTL